MYKNALCNDSMIGLKKWDICPEDGDPPCDSSLDDLDDLNGALWLMECDGSRFDCTMYPCLRRVWLLVLCVDS